MIRWDKILKRFSFSLLMVCCLKFTHGATPEKQTQPKKNQTLTEVQWPREFKKGEAKLVMYAPQIENWKDFNQMQARVAIAFSKKGKEAPSLGTFLLNADTEVDHETRLVKVKNMKASEVKFPSLPADLTGKISAEIENVIPKDDVFISLDRVLANLERSAVQIQELNVKNDPPKIFVNFKPSALLILDGQPIWSPVKDNDLKWAVNTNWDLFFHEKSNKYYLLNQNSWLETSDLKSGWTQAFQLPDGLSKLPQDDPNWEDVRKNLPGKRLKPEEIPHVYYSEVPAELISIAGEPKLEIIPGANVQWVSNTESDLFFYPADRQFYYLVSGRWFRADSLTGDWKFATGELPEEFTKIPADHPRGDVRASIPGTRESDEAIILASIPQKAQVDRSKVNAEVQYSGDPQFKPIEGTSMSYAVNTSNSVVKVGDMYFLCYQAVWFASQSPKGPWKVADSIPKEVYTIPPSSPVHNVTYVYVYESTPAYVTYGYTSGYFGVYYAHGCMVYGTGWYYPPYYHWGGYYPYYYSWPNSYGVAAWYNPYTGTYGRGAYYYGPYGGAGYAARYNPATGTYARGGYAYGPYNARGWAEAYNPRTGTYARTHQGANVYGNWGSTYVQRGDDWARTGHVAGKEAGAWGYGTSGGNKGFVGHNGDDLYAGRNGNVYRKSDDGWQEFDKGGWNNVEKTKPAPKERPSTANVNKDTLNQLNRDNYNRNRGTQRTQSSSAWRNSGGSRSRSGSYRRR